MKPRVLVTDDQQSVIAALQGALAQDGIEVVSVTCLSDVMVAAAGQRFDAALIDVDSPRDGGQSRIGLEQVAKLHWLDVDLPVIAMSAAGSLEAAKEAMRIGARDFLEKPWETARLLSVVRTQLELGRLLRRRRQLEEENLLLRQSEYGEIVSESQAMEKLLDTARRVAESDASVLITGERGTGKSLLAAWLHQWSPRQSRSLVSVNVGEVSGSVFESEMFGHVRGVFMDARSERLGCLELAESGTLFLDEIENLAAAEQATLLKVLEDGEFKPIGSSRTRRLDVRLICAMNMPMRQLVEDGRIRRDLLRHINTVEVRMPALRERSADVRPLAMIMLAAAVKRFGRHIDGFVPKALEALEGYKWPGNGRELRNVIERGVLAAAGSKLEVGDLRLGLIDDKPPCPCEGR